jgi:ankyrin repeat protein
MDDRGLFEVMRAVAAGDGASATGSLRSSPDLATATLSPAINRSAADYFLEDCGLQLYSGDTLLHVAAAAYDTGCCELFVDAGADVRARNRRGAEPLHAATNGNPQSTRWNPRAQAEVIGYLIGAGADPDALAAGGVTPLHRAVRNRCAAAVSALLDAGADPSRRNDNGSSALDLAGRATGRGGSGSAPAKAQQAEIVRLLTDALAAGGG